MMKSRNRVGAGVRAPGVDRVIERKGEKRRRERGNRREHADG